MLCHAAGVAPLFYPYPPQVNFVVLKMGVASKGGVAGPRFAIVQPHHQTIAAGCERVVTDSPLLKGQPTHFHKMSIVAYQWQPILQGSGGNPDVILRDRAALFP